MTTADQRRSRRLQRALRWLYDYLDVLLPIVLAFSVGLIDFTSDLVPEDARFGFTMAVLGIMAIASFKDRSAHGKTVEESVTRSVGPLEEQVERTARSLEDNALIRTVRPDEMYDVHRRARQDTTQWQFKGGTGSHIRPVTLPELVQAARERRSRLTVHIEIIDPGSTESCQEYSRFRQSFSPPGSAGPWTLDRTRKGSYATVLAAFWHLNRLPTLDISVHTTTRVSALRYDLSDRYLILTQDDPTRENFLIERESLLYKYFEIELHQSRNHAPRIDFSGATELSDYPTADEARTFFDAVGKPLPSYSDSEVSEIIELALNGVDPYRR
ncbi:hypothetical protein [Streptomyces sp. NPDC053560]|uniref:hypothetical protein n=1 Tax=Streptomyces sp. NPDC053560 TaxID=3365711 RepID=UPI0037D018C6